MILTEVAKEILYRGTIFRFPPHNSWYDEYLYLMLVLSPESFVMVIISGYKAGHVTATLPEDALFPKTHALSTAWLQKNWHEWVWPNTPASEVEVIVPDSQNKYGVLI